MAAFFGEFGLGERGVGGEEFFEELDESVLKFEFKGFEAADGFFVAFQQVGVVGCE